MADRKELRTDFVSRDVNTAKTLKDIGAAADKAADQVDELGDQADQTGEKLDDLGVDAAQGAAILKTLDQAADGARNSIRELALEAARSGDLTLFKDINKQRRELNRLSELRNILTDVGEDSASGFAAGFVGRLGPLLVRATPQALGAAGPPVMAVGAGMAAGLAALMGSAIGAGVAGAAAGGGIIGGLTIASKHPAVQAEAARTANVLGEMLQRSAISFVPAAQDGLRILRGDILDVEDDLSAIFDRTSTFVPGLAHSVGDSIRELAGGVRELVDEAGPVIDMLGNRLPQLADAVADGLGDLSDNTASGAQALGILFLVVEAGTRAFFGLVNVLAEAYGWMARVGAVVTGNHAGLAQLAQDNVEAADTGSELRTELQGLLAGFQATGSAVSTTANEIERMNQLMREVHDANLSAAEANLRYRESLNAAKEAADGKRAVTAGEERALLDLARASNATTEALEKQGVSTADLTARTNSARKSFVDVAMRMGYTEEQAEALADSYLDVPGRIKTDVNLNKQQAERDLATFNAKANHATRDRTMTIGVYWTSSGDLKVPGGTLTKSEGGMILGPGPKGVDSVPMVGAPGEYVVRASSVDKPGVLPLLEAINSGQWRPDMSPPASAQALPGSGAGGGMDLYALADLLERSLRRALAAAPIMQVSNAGYQADLYQRGG